MIPSAIEFSNMKGAFEPSKNSELRNLGNFERNLRAISVSPNINENLHLKSIRGFKRRMLRNNDNLNQNQSFQIHHNNINILKGNNEVMNSDLSGIYFHEPKGNSLSNERNSYNKNHFNSNVEFSLPILKSRQINEINGKNQNNFLQYEPRNVNESLVKNTKVKIKRSIIQDYIKLITILRNKD